MDDYTPRLAKTAFVTATWHCIETRDSSLVDGLTQTDSENGRVHMQGSCGVTAMCNDDCAEQTDGRYYECDD